MYTLIVLETDAGCDNIFVSLQSSLRRTPSLQSGLNLDPIRILFCLWKFDPLIWLVDCLPPLLLFNVQPLQGVDKTNPLLQAWIQSPSLHWFVKKYTPPSQVGGKLEIDPGQ